MKECVYREYENKDDAREEQKGGAPAKGVDHQLGHGKKDHGPYADPRKDDAARQSSLSKKPSGNQGHVGRKGKHVNADGHDHAKENVEMEDGGYHPKPI